MAGRAQYDVLRIMRTLAGGDEETTETSPRKGRPTTPRTWHPDILTTDDILQEKYQELGKLLASQYVERKALSVLETTLLGQKKRKARPVSAKRSSKTGKQKRQSRPAAASTSVFSQSADESPWWYDSDGTDYTETSATSSAKRVSFADDVVSCGESSVIITELTEDDAEFEERIRRKPRVTLEEEEMEANELRYGRDKRDIKRELMRSILRSPRSSSSRRRAKSPKRSPTPTTPRSKSPKRTTKSDKQNANVVTQIQFDDDINDGVEVQDDSTIVGSDVEDSEKTNVHFDDDDDDEIGERKTRRNKSPRKGAKRSTTPRERSKSPRKENATRTSSPSRKNSKKKRSPQKKKIIKDEEDVALEPESPRKEYVPLDNQLTQSQNKHIKSWLRKKEADLRKQKREERKKEREKMEAARKERELRAERIAEAEGKYDEWMTNKKKTNKMNKRVARKVSEDGAADQNQDCGGADEMRSKSPKRSPRRSRYSVRKKKEYVPPVTTHDNNIGIVRDYTGDWSESVNCKRDLAAERERDEEKRQAREAKKRERIQKAARAAERKNDPKPKRTFPRASKSPPKTSPPLRKIEKHDKSVTSNKPKPTRPSNNPFKGMTYDEWLNQKIKSEQTRKEEMDQELEDPDLADLIPLLAKHRIQQAKETSRRVDSGLSRPKSSAAPRKAAETSKAFDVDDQTWRPYTWNNSSTKKSKDNQWTSFPKRTSSSPSPRSSPVSTKRDSIGVRPEPQGCELPSHISHCQKGGKDNGDQNSVFMTETSVATWKAMSDIG